MALGSGERETQNDAVAIKSLATVVDQHHNPVNINATSHYDQATAIVNGNSTTENNDKGNAKSARQVTDIIFILIYTLRVKSHRPPLATKPETMNFGHFTIPMVSNRQVPSSWIVGR